ncbi:MAG: thiamine phosphate synthase, partial [Acidobacteriota bacterium]|nr:thiamine phosphate synthase [Acidobacteriota bacterium]
VIAAVKMPIDYLAFGPVFNTTTKENPDAAVGIENLQKVRQIIGDFPLVAIGGITSENFREVLEAGANSVAVISSLLSDADKITERMRFFLKL